MDSNQIQILLAITQTILALVAIIVSIGVSLHVYYGTRKLMTLQYMRTSFDAWMTLDTFLLSHPDLIKLARVIERPDLEEASQDADKKRLVGFIVLNPYVSYYYAMRHNLIDENFIQTIKQSLSNIIRDEEIYRLTQQEIFAEGFADFCKELKKSDQDLRGNVKSNVADNDSTHVK